MRRIVLSPTANGNFPAIFKEIKGKIGCEATAKLVEQYGGTALYVPHKISIEHPLYQLLGEKISQQLSSEFGGLIVEINRDIGLQIARRNKQIRADRAAGMTQSAAALKYQLTTRTIRKITNS